VKATLLHFLRKLAASSSHPVTAKDLDKTPILSPQC